MVERKVFFIEWKRSSIEFIKGITLNSSLTGILVVHIFYSQDTPSNILPKYRPWLFKHPVPKDNGETAVLKAIEECILKFKFTDEKPEYSKKQTSTTGFLVTTQENHQHVAKLVEKIASTNAVKVTVIQNKNTTLLDLVDFKCSVCKVVFKEKKQVEKHDIDCHSFVCYNSDCHHSNKDHCFASEEELQTHLRSQLRCEFCPGRVFCTRDYLLTHLKTTHKQCPCPCGNYFGTREAFLDHFFSFYPTPKGITARFLSLQNKAPEKKPPKKRSVVTKPNSVENWSKRYNDNESRLASPESDNL